MKLGFIGDIHGKTQKLDRLVEKLAKDSIDYIYQVGDMGLGFSGVELPEQPENFKFIRGNHDNPATCKAHPSYLGEYGGKLNGRMFFVGGAWSIDYRQRIRGKSWWEDEELSIIELNNAIEMYKHIKPSIVMTHDCPSSLTETLLKPFLLFGGEPIKTRTGQALQAMFEIHKPKHWIFGHYHLDKDFELEGTHFRCLNELSVYQLDTAAL